MQRLHPVVRAILPEHPLNYTLTAHYSVPEVYLQHFWYTLAYVQVGRHFRFQGSIDNTKAEISQLLLRRILHFPARDFFDHLDHFADTVSETQLFKEISVLGYARPLTKMRDFHRAHIQGIWFQVFSILKRCLMSKATGTDTTSISMLRMFHAFTYHCLIDYATIIWYDLIDVVTAKLRANKAWVFVPFTRFLQLIVRRCMRQTPDIQRWDNLPKGQQHEMQYLIAHVDNPKINVHPIPLDLFRLADRSDEAIQAYLEEFYPEHQQTPSPATSNEKERASESESKSSDGESSNGSESEND